jgi:hypothetical protein
VARERALRHKYLKCIIRLLPIVFCVVSFKAGDYGFEGANHDCGAYTWEHSLDEWATIEAQQETPHLVWQWVPLNMQNAPGDLSHGGHHEEWGWYKVLGTKNCNWLTVSP